MRWQLQRDGRYHLYSKNSVLNMSIKFTLQRHHLSVALAKQQDEISRMRDAVKAEKTLVQCPPSAMAYKAKSAEVF